MIAPPETTRPLAVRLVLWGVLLLALWNAGRAIALWLEMSRLADLPQLPNPQVRMGLAVLWALAFFLSAAALWRCWPLSRKLVPILIALYGVYELGIMIAYATVSPAPLSAFVYALFVVFTLWALWRPGAGRYFQPRHLEDADPSHKL